MASKELSTLAVKSGWHDVFQCFSPSQSTALVCKHACFVFQCFSSCALCVPLTSIDHNVLAFAKQEKTWRNNTRGRSGNIICRSGSVLDACPREVQMTRGLFSTAEDAEDAKVQLWCGSSGSTLIANLWSLSSLWRYAWGAHWGLRTSVKGSQQLH